jgi:hypothetical protein
MRAAGTSKNVPRGTHAAQVIVLRPFRVSAAIRSSLLVGLLDVLPEKIDNFRRGLRRSFEK